MKQSEPLGRQTAREAPSGGIDESDPSYLLYTLIAKQPFFAGWSATAQTLAFEKPPKMKNGGDEKCNERKH